MVWRTVWRRLCADGVRVWLRGRRDPQSGIYLNAAIIFALLCRIVAGWFLTGFGMSHYGERRAHRRKLIVGLAMAFVDTLNARKRTCEGVSGLWSKIFFGRANAAYPARRLVTFQRLFMKQTQRHDAIIELVKKRGVRQYGRAGGHFSVNPQTIRRDLNDLAEQNMILRHHGGGVALQLGETCRGTS